MIDRVDRDQLSLHGAAEPARTDDPQPLENFRPAASPFPGHEIRMVDEAGHELGERREGRIEFRGPSATSGYFRNEGRPASCFMRWLAR